MGSSLAIALDGFVAHLYTSDPIGFNYLTTIVKGSVLASVLYLDDLGQVATSFRGVEFYLDTQLLMRACGFAGDVQAEAACDLLTLLQTERGRLRCFEHTVKEMEGILDAALAVVRDPRRKRSATGETVTNFLEMGYQASDVAQFQVTLRNRLAGLGVAIRDTPTVTVDLSTDERKFEELLKDHVTYSHDGQLVADVNSLTAVHRLRRGEATRKLEQCRALFVTPNMAVVAAGRKQFSDLYHKDCIPVAIGTNDLVAIA